MKRANSSFYDVGQGDTTIHAWDALNRWSLDELMADERLRERTFKCGEDDDGNTIRLKLKHFLRYVQKNRDDSPLYVFHSDFDEDRIAKRLLCKYLLNIHALLVIVVRLMIIGVV